MTLTSCSDYAGYRVRASRNTHFSHAYLGFEAIHIEASF